MLFDRTRYNVSAMRKTHIMPRRDPINRPRQSTLYMKVSFCGAQWSSPSFFPPSSLCRASGRWPPERRRWCVGPAIPGPKPLGGIAHILSGMCGIFTFKRRMFFTEHVGRFFDVIFSSHYTFEKVLNPDFLRVLNTQEIQSNSFGYPGPNNCWTRTYRKGCSY